MSTRKNDYVTLSTPGTKKISVCGRRIGSRDRMAVIAVCTDEAMAEKIVDALNHMQGELAKLEAPAQRVLEEVREVLTKERALMDGVKREKRELEKKVLALETEINIAKQQRDRAIMDRDIAQKAALEKA